MVDGGTRSVYVATVKEAERLPHPILINTFRGPVLYGA